MGRKAHRGYFSWLKKSLRRDTHEESVEIFVKVARIEIGHRLLKVYVEGRGALHRIPQVRVGTPPGTFYHYRLPRTV